jgi:hypothetical protein
MEKMGQESSQINVFLNIEEENAIKLETKILKNAALLETEHSALYGNLMYSLKKGKN